ncbi:unnamed protein product [Zymoseptoria tritici ST99CH_3D7]|uniref:Uncharacterized protein n=1 Tax=Zymoseptoria tritici (strain ST99CH_3D7) TaxID=1276538 RepID=A0A1X7S6E6_ZYMT9|nr:unnamed protein product [Zymoseptoria tritici ST99CH_3D7]
MSKPSQEQEQLRLQRLISLRRNFSISHIFETLSTFESPQAKHRADFMSDDQKTWRYPGSGYTSWTMTIGGTGQK